MELIEETADINTGSAEYLVISHPDFIDGLTVLVNERKQQYSVKMVDVEDIYYHYSHGIFDPEAVRNYIAYAAKSLGTQYVLLVGGDTYDYMDYLNKGSVSFIPTIYEASSDIITFAPSDSVLADVDGDKVQDVAIGRFPVRTDTELASIIEKTLHYPSAIHQSTAVFAADKQDGVVSFMTQSNRLAGKLPESWSVDTAYLDELSVTDARTALIDAINSGRALTSFFGHSDSDRWTFSGLFNITDAKNLTNADLPTVVTQYGCWNTYFVDPNNNSLGHGFLLEGNKGAAAVTGPSTRTDTSSDLVFGNNMLNKLFVPGTTLGKAVRDTKQDLRGSFEKYKDVMIGWTLLGDPALEVVQ